MAGFLEYIVLDPYDYYAERLAEAPVQWDEGMHAWLVFVRRPASGRRRAQAVA